VRDANTNSRNHWDWCERNSHADSPYASLWTLLEIHRKQFGKIIVRGVSTAGAAAQRHLEDHLAALVAGAGAPTFRALARMSWLDFALNPLPDLFAAPPGGVSSKVKDALPHTAATVPSPARSCAPVAQNCALRRSGSCIDMTMTMESTLAVPSRHGPRPVPPTRVAAHDRSARLTLLAASFGLGMALLDATAVNVAVPSVQASLHTDVRGLSWVIDGYTLSFASLLLLAGGLGDRVGAKRVFLAGLALFTLASALCGAAIGLGTLVLARILQGVGAALFMPSSLSILRQAYPEQASRARAIGIWSALTAVAGAAGPPVGGALVAALGWRSIFLLNIPLGTVALVVTLRVVRPSPTADRKGLDLPAQLTGAGSLALLAWALIERSARGWGSPLIVGALLAAAAGLVLFVRLERRSECPIMPLELFANRTFRATASAALLYAGAFFGALLVFSLYFQRIRGEAPGAAGLHIAAIGLTFGLTSIATGRIAGRYGTRSPILAGLATLSASALAFSSLPAAAPFALLAPALLSSGVGAGLVAPAMNAAILANVPPGLSGIGAGVLNAARQVGTALGVAVFASFFSAGASMRAVRASFLCAAVLYAASFVIAMGAVHGRRRAS
jgi:DHA2 family methylenomycin A resistance protein-like MFS transporter